MSSSTEHISLQVLPGGLYFIAYSENRKKESDLFDQFKEKMSEYGVSFENIEKGWCG